MKVYKVADVIDGKLRLPDKKSKQWKLLLEAIKPASESFWVDFQLTAGQNDDKPAFLGMTKVIHFHDQLFVPEHHPAPAEIEGVFLKIKKIVYDEEAKIASLRAEVSSIESAAELAKTSKKRAPISESVKLAVWNRDGGACVKCGSNKAIHFDHIIPIAKGGSDSFENLQILCQICNLKKSDKIAS